MKLFLLVKTWPVGCSENGAKFKIWLVFREKREKMVKTGLFILAQYCWFCSYFVWTRVGKSSWNIVFSNSISKLSKIQIHYIHIFPLSIPWFLGRKREKMSFSIREIVLSFEGGNGTGNPPYVSLKPCICLDHLIYIYIYVCMFVCLIFFCIWKLNIGLIFSALLGIGAFRSQSGYFILFVCRHASISSESHFSQVLN